MKRTRWSAAALAVATMTIAPAWAETKLSPLPEPRTCLDCCKLPCLEAQLWEARYRRFVYDRMSKLPGIDKRSYLNRESEAKVVSETMKRMFIGNNETCNPAMPSTPTEAVNWGADYGLGTEWNDKGQVDKLNYSLMVDPETCKMNKPNVERFYPSYATCRDIGEAILAHEQQHMKECEARVEAAKKSRKPPAELTPAENAKSEVAGYDREIQKLEQAAKGAAKDCLQGSCKSNQPAFDRTARLLGTDLAKLAGKAKKKPPTNSPTRRRQRGN